MTESNWSQERGSAALRKADALARKQADESHQAAVLIHEFVGKAESAGVDTEVLTATSYDGASRYRTNVTGWYLKHDRTVGVSHDGAFYVLTAPPRFMSRFTGATIEPSPPPLELGKGGRDGESMPIATALHKCLAAGNDW